MDDCDGSDLVDVGAMVVIGALPKVSCVTDGFARINERKTNDEIEWFAKGSQQWRRRELTGAMTQFGSCRSKGARD